MRNIDNIYKMQKMLYSGYETACPGRGNFRRVQRDHNRRGNFVFWGAEGFLGCK